jgi:hypothetical protein
VIEVVDLNLDFKVIIKETKHPKEMSMLLNLLLENMNLVRVL